MLQTVKNYIYGGTSQPINLIIGGMGSTITSKELLMNYLSIPNVSRIRRFEIVGNDVHVNINGIYGTKMYSFRDNTDITSFLDLSNNCITLERSSFENATNFRSVKANNISVLRNSVFRNTPLDFVFEVNPNITLSEQYALNGCKMSSYPFANSFTHTNGFAFSNNSSVEYINFPNLTGIGNAEFQNLVNLKEIQLSSLVNLLTSTLHFSGLTSCNLISMRKFKTFNNNNVGAGSVFANLKLNCTIEVHIDCKTINSGNPPVQITWAKNNRGAIVNFYDDNGNYVSTL